MWHKPIPPAKSFAMDIFTHGRESVQKRCLHSIALAQIKPTCAERRLAPPLQLASTTGACLYYPRSVFRVYSLGACRLWAAVFISTQAGRIMNCPKRIGAGKVRYRSMGQRSRVLMRCMFKTALIDNDKLADPGSIQHFN